MLFGTWLQSARARESAAGVDHRELACYAGKLTNYTQEELSRALHRLERLYIRIPPSPLGEKEQRQMWEERRSDFISEIRESLDNIAAVLAALGCTEEELEAAGARAEDAETGETEDDVESTNASSGSGNPEDETVVMPLARLAVTSGHDTEK